MTLALTSPWEGFLRHRLVPLGLNEVDLGGTPPPGSWRKCSKSSHKGQHSANVQTVVVQPPRCFHCTKTLIKTIIIILYILSAYNWCNQEKHISRITSPKHVLVPSYVLHRLAKAVFSRPLFRCSHTKDWRCSSLSLSDKESHDRQEEFATFLT